MRRLFLVFNTAGLLLSTTPIFGDATLGETARSAADAPPAARLQAAKYRVARTIFDDLIRAIGDGRTPPRLRLLPADETVDMGAVWFEPDAGAVLLEERAYDALTAGPDSLDALAFVLGHELAHYYKDHNWTGDFARSFADLDVGRTLKGLAGSSRRSTEIETESDYFSGFFGRMAGYRPMAAAPAALQQIYDEYGLGEPLPGYPTLTDRQAVATRTAQKLRQLVPIFDGGNWLLLTGRSTEAAACFDYVARTFPSREILNNAGVARARAAIDLFGPGELPFPYPLELDATTRLREEGKADRYEWEGDTDDRRQRLLSEAHNSLESARRRDPTYLPAIINLACVADLQSQQDEALLLARRAVKMARETGDKTSLAHALLIQGIAAARGETPDRAVARQHFSTAQTDGGLLARQALAALDGTSTPRATVPVSSTTELIGGLTAREYDLALEAPDLVVDVPAIFADESKLTFYRKNTPQGSSLVIDTGYSTFSFRQTQGISRPTSAHGIELGATWQQVSAAYGVPTRSVASGSQNHLVYQSQKIVFDLRANAVTGWLIYDVE
ncbi:MAG: hypothetical protein HOM68_18475 [Gemmatimonadetes bacterium]|jgi:tetratricopeptide (TPR) repeat protein|nr:hypothetical protein [Gemmatimonadota bacterium]MBT5058533.1 hypothetical protein [Gemmatimonadota bacterium]MBT5144853.1 hypothetical protein [Gemmatimonadota bacterium]MBT5586502.1 hypothetical protein [Gemmatimonadota bacterium]MBT5960487.1 hypothetical protein [Gemmatimonadota bacterium]